MILRKCPRCVRRGLRPADGTAGYQCRHCGLELEFVEQPERQRRLMIVLSFGFAALGLVLVPFEGLVGVVLVAWPVMMSLALSLLDKPVAPGGLCEQCGYDLRGSQHRCPECGLSFHRPIVARDESKAVQHTDHQANPS